VNKQLPTLTPTKAVALFAIIVIVLLWAFQLRMGPELLDDGAFFLRYAENAANGEFWVWNPGEAPVWGASAPFYPIIVALPIKLGLDPHVAIVATGAVIASISFATLALMLGARFGIVTLVAFVTYLALDSNMMWMSINGLESPLTVALMVAAVWTLMRQPHAALVGLVAGLLIINKLDLLPVGGLLLLARWVQFRRFPWIAVAVAAAITAGWYGFAWWYFGAPIPNSFLTKTLHQNDMVKIIDWTWFGHLVLWVGVHKWLVVLTAATCLLGLRANLPYVILLAGTTIAHVIAYSIKFPFEPYNWYAVPASFSLVILGAIGTGLVFALLQRHLPGSTWSASALILLLLVGVTATSLPEERARTDGMYLFTSHQEHDRAEAGRWVDENVPDDFKVLTYWGNPAYFSRREVIDGSFLNRRYEEGDLAEIYRPEVVIRESQAGMMPTAPNFPELTAGGYKVVNVFDKTYRAGMDYFFVVLVRDDVVDQVRNVDMPRDLMRFVSNVTFGDVYGRIDVRGTNMFFVHPGETTATSFDFDAASYADSSSKCSVHVDARIHSGIPAAVVARGGGNVRIRILRGEEEIENSVVTLGEPMWRDLPCQEGQPIRFIVENNGSPDSDWLWLTFE
tara:strand:- start:2895 stop:4763 length:1869 start_codon:yes stop_codon:yes gene_type:complete